MRITKLHILVFLLACGLGYSAYYYHKETKREQQEMEARAMIERMEHEKEQAAREEVEPASRAEFEAQAAIAPSTAAPSTPVVYTTKKGDTLWSIAKSKDHFGQGHRWYDIWKANEEKIEDFDHVPAGVELAIPLDKPDGYEWPLTPEDKKQKILSKPWKRRRAPQPATN